MQLIYCSLLFFAVNGFGIACLALLTLTQSGSLIGQENANRVEGLILSVRSISDPQREDVKTVSVPALYVPEGEAVSPFLPADAFVAVWTGFLNVPLRDYYTFQAELNGALQIQINGNAVYEGAASGDWLSASEEFRLNKGGNEIRIEYKSPGDRPAWMRLYWAGYDFAMEPVSPEAFTHETSSEDDSIRLRRKGRSLFNQYRCANCHGSEQSQPPSRLILGNAPGFAGIGDRLTRSWMKAWIADPQQFRESATMPKLMHGGGSEREIAAMAAFLSALQSGDHLKENDGTIEKGKGLYAQLHCAACHGDPDDAGELKPELISLNHVGWKFKPGRLAQFLAKPERHDPWIRMPNFNLAEAEAADLSAYLRSVHPTREDDPFEAALTEIEQGRQLIQAKGCLQCHELPGTANAFRHSPVPIRSWQNGCLDISEGTERKAPLFPLTAEDVAALRAFGESGNHHNALKFVAADFAQDQLERLKCMNCHEQIEGVPSLEGIGAKLRGDWMEALLSGNVENKTRPWLAARMPAYPAYAQGLAAGLSHLRGHPYSSTDQAVRDDAMVETGRKLVSASGGFACVSCHAVRHQKAAQVFEAEGVNFAYSGRRLRPSYFKRWMSNPQRIDPQTKMPVYFPDGESPLFEVYDGDAERQIEAMWQYILLGPEMPLPD